MNPECTLDPLGARALDPEWDAGILDRRTTEHRHLVDHAFRHVLCLLSAANRRFQSGRGAAHNRFACTLLLPAAEAATRNVGAMLKQRIGVRDTKPSKPLNETLALPRDTLMWRCGTCSAGALLMQLAVPELRTGAAQGSFTKELASCNFSLDDWRHEP